MAETLEKQKQSDLSFPGKVAFDGRVQLAISDTGHNRIIVAWFMGDGKQRNGMRRLVAAKLEARMAICRGSNLFQSSAREFAWMARI